MAEDLGAVVWKLCMGSAVQGATDENGIGPYLRGGEFVKLDDYEIALKKYLNISEQLAELEENVQRSKRKENVMEISSHDLRKMLCEESSDTAPAGNRHPYYNRRVLAVMPHGFIHFGLLRQQGGYLILKNASNLRYWSKRDGGLPEFAQKGPGSDDKIDKIGEVVLETPMFFYLLGDWGE